MSNDDKKTIRVTLKRSLIGTIRSHRECARGLGLRRTGHTREVVDNAINRGLIKKIDYLVEVSEK